MEVVHFKLIIVDFNCEVCLVVLVFHHQPAQQLLAELLFKLPVLVLVGFRCAAHEDQLVQLTDLSEVIGERTKERVILDRT